MYTLTVCRTYAANTYKVYTVQEFYSALARYEDGDEIKLQAGTYLINAITLEKSVTLAANGKVILDFQEKSEGIIVAANNVTIKDFEIKNTSRGSLKDIAGIRAENIQNLKIYGMRLTNTFFGIYLSNVNGACIFGNILQGKAPDQSNSGNGVHLWKCEYIQILKNYITGHRDGIYFEFAKRGFIWQNYSYQNHRYGLHFMFSDSNYFLKNEFNNNGTGVAVMYSKYILMHRNTYFHNWGAAAYGMLLKDIKESKIENNIFKKNTTAMYFEGSSKLQIKNNDFINNGWAIKLLSSCQEDTFMQNNFVANTFDVSTNGTLYLNFFNRNYWDKYQGYDLDKNLIGDVPHRPVSMYSILIEKMPPVIFLSRSILVNIMDKTEQNVPAFIPESVKDNNPAFVKIKR